MSSNKLILGAIFSVIGLATAGYGVRSYFLAKESQAWPQVKGTIVSSEVRSHETKNRNKMNKRNTSSVGITVGNLRLSKGDPQTKGSVTYSPSVVFEYTINGTKFLSDRVSFTGLKTSRISDAQTIVSRYPAGAEATVRYNPSDPAFSVLEPGAGVGEYFLIGIGLFFAFVGIGFIVSQRRSDGHSF